MLEAWRQRPIPPISHLILDARYEKVRVGGTVRSCAVLSAIGIRREDGRRMILGVSVSLSEAEVHWREFLSSLKARGLHTCSSTTSDAHEGLKAAAAPASPPSSPTPKVACVWSQPSSWKSPRLGKPPKLTSTHNYSNNPQPLQPTTSPKPTFTEKLLLNPCISKRCPVRE
jgi:Transposase, Mutator family